ncbi:MAG TPA: hypothetical protein HPP69_10585 [Deltaproteobacteria bacterium]|nr:hypothetical protein [Deltaproteobacteria bacterium]
MGLCILKAKDLFQMTPFIPKRSKADIINALQVHRGLMIFFVFCYCVVAATMFLKIHLMGEMFVGVVFLSGAIFVLVGIRLQVKMILEIKNTLQGLLPICSSCKKIRTPESDPEKPESWSPVEQYISQKTAADFTHSVCPDCLKKLYPQFYK